MPSAEPYTGLDERVWTWIDVPGAVCLDGSATGIGVSRGSSSDVLVFFMGGGACWDFLTCWTLGTAVTTYGEAAFDAAPPTVGVLDRGDAKNPFRDWTMVFVPYCTADLHAGTNVIDYSAGEVTKTAHHVGAANVEAWLARLVATFPSPARLVVAGSSAGGYGATLQYDHLRRAFAPAASWLVDDSGPLLEGASINDSLRTAWFDHWHLADVTEPVCGTTCRDDLSAMYTKLAERWPDDGMSLLSSTFDTVIESYLGLAPTDFQAALQALANDVFAAAGVRWFYVVDTTHTMLGNPASFTAGGVELRDWLKAMLDGPSWTSKGP
ncbi:MAG: pectin acetylesterase-family hydrolase [Myxococcota bacterium]